MTPAILFFAGGAFWAVITLLGGGVFLLWPAATSILSGLLLLLLPASRFTKPLYAASGLFGIVLTLYQVYVGLTDIGTILNTVAFLLATVLYAYLLVFAYPKEEKV
jgi:hypothetical protein